MSIWASGCSVVKIADASDMGIMQRALDWRNCMAAPTSSSISLATCCSVPSVDHFSHAGCELFPPSTLSPLINQEHKLLEQGIQHTRFGFVSVISQTHQTRQKVFCWPTSTEDKGTSATSWATAPAPPSRLILRTWLQEEVRNVYSNVKVKLIDLSANLHQIWVYDFLVICRFLSIYQPLTWHGNYLI